MTNLDPRTKVYLERINQLPPLHKMEPQAVRDLYAQIPPVEVELAPIAKIEDKLIPVGAETEITIRIYTPEGQGPFPLFVYYHGGGWVIGDLETVDASCRMLAHLSGRIVVSVDYRLAPEHKFPVPVSDSYAALQWVSENATSINGSASDLVVGGDSAGGNLSAVVSLLARDQNGPAIKAQVLIYPVTDMRFDSPSYMEYQEGYGLNRDLMIWFSNHYINHSYDKSNPFVTPLTARDLSNLPPAIVITAECDVLRDEGMAYAERLKQAGIQVESYCEQGLVHGYFTNMLVFSERIKATISRITEFLQAIDQIVIK